MADLVLQWQSHVTDSTDREVILGNIDFLESLASSIIGDATLHANFEGIRTGIKDGSLNPVSWKANDHFVKITEALNKVSSGKLLKRVGSAEVTLEEHTTALSEKLDSSAFEGFKEGAFKVITDWKEDLDEKLPTFAPSSELENLKKTLGALGEKYTESNDKLSQIAEDLEEEKRKAEGRDKQLKVVVTTKGYIKNGAIVDGERVDGTPAIVHTAHVYTLFGKPVISGIKDKLTWTINKGRKTDPKEEKVTGLVCKVSQDQFVKDGTNPHYYNIELTSNF